MCRLAFSLYIFWNPDCHISVTDKHMKNTMFYAAREIDFQDLVLRPDVSMNMRLVASGEVLITAGVEVGEAGAFKTAHRALVKLDNGGNMVGSLRIDGPVIAKQRFVMKLDGSIARLDARHEAEDLTIELKAMEWGSSLLRFVYAFMANLESTKGKPTFFTPRLSFVACVMAKGVADKQKVVLLEDYISEEDGRFMKYVHNALPRPTEDIQSEDELHTAQFLCFAQHAQYHLTEGTVYTSDFQG